MRIREPFGVSVLAGVNRYHSILHGIRTDIRNFRESPPPPPPRLWLQLKDMQEQELVAPGDRTTLKSAFQSSATTLIGLCKLRNVHLSRSSENVTELVIRLCDTFHSVSNVSHAARTSTCSCQYFKNRLLWPLILIAESLGSLTQRGGVLRRIDSFQVCFLQHFFGLN